jgi:hypothetical protein
MSATRMRMTPAGDPRGVEHVPMGIAHATNNHLLVRLCFTVFGSDRE